MGIRAGQSELRAIAETVHKGTTRQSCCKSKTLKRRSIEAEKQKELQEDWDSTHIELYKLEEATIPYSDAAATMAMQSGMEANASRSRSVVSG